MAIRIIVESLFDKLQIYSAIKGAWLILMICGLHILDTYVVSKKKKIIWFFVGLCIYVGGVVFFTYTTRSVKEELRQYMYSDCTEEIIKKGE